MRLVRPVSGLTQSAHGNGHVFLYRVACRSWKPRLVLGRGDLGTRAPIDVTRLTERRRGYPQVRHRYGSSHYISYVN